MSAAVAVAIHLAPELRPDFALRTLKSCEAALGREQCRLTDDATSDDEFYATVTAEHDDASAHIVLQHHGATEPVAERDLSFAPEDPPADRWASVGVVIAALVTAESGRAPPPVAPSPKPPPPKPVPAAPPPPSYPIWIDVLAQLARKTSTNYPAELGGQLRVAFAPARSPLFTRVMGGYASRLAPQPDLSILSGGIGGGLRWGRPDARWGAEIHVEALAERWIWSASEPGRVESSGVWRFGAGAGVDATWGFTGSLQAVLGVSAQVLAPDLTVDIRGQNGERVPVAGAAVVAGLRFLP